MVFLLNHKSLHKTSLWLLFANIYSQTAGKGKAKAGSSLAQYQGAPAGAGGLGIEPNPLCFRRAKPPERLIDSVVVHA
jgi:hypothetical protein